MMMLSCYKALLFYIMCELICTYNTNAAFISLTLNTQQSMPKQMRFQWIHDNTNNKTAPYFALVLYSFSMCFAMFIAQCSYELAKLSTVLLSSRGEGQHFYTCPTFLSANIYQCPAKVERFWQRWWVYTCGSQLGSICTVVCLENY